MGPKIGCRGEGMPEWGLVLEGAPQKTGEGRGWAWLELGCAWSSRGHGAERGPIPVPGQHSHKRQRFTSAAKTRFSSLASHKGSCGQPRLTPVRGLQGY